MWLGKSDKAILFIAAGVGFLGNLAANYVWSKSDDYDIDGPIGLTASIAFLALIIVLILWIEHEN